VICVDLEEGLREDAKYFSVVAPSHLKRGDINLSDKIAGAQYPKAPTGGKS
jgi:hypothetical protein